jgi:hypothetical protein
MLMRKHNTVFVHIPKTGGSSIGLALNPHRDLRAIVVRRTNKSLQSLRLPYRLKGIDTISHGTAQDYASVLGDDFSQYFSFSVVRNPFDWIVSFYHFQLKRGKTEMSFREFVEKPVAKPQTDYIFDSDDKIMVSFVARFEKLAEDFATVSAKIGLDLRLPHVNSTAHAHFSSYYDRQSQALIVKHYRRDFELLGYSTEL